MNSQEAFNNTWNYHVVEGNPLGYDAKRKICVYIDAEGHRCAIGCQLPDRLAEKAQYRNMSIGEAMLKMPKVEEIFKDAEYSLLCELQNAHDCAARGEPLWFVAGRGSVKDWDDALTAHGNLKTYYRIVAKRFGLEAPEDSHV